MDRFAEALEVVDLALAEEFDGVADVGVIDEAQDIVIGHARLLFGGEVLVEIREHIAFDGEGRRIERHARRRDGVDACGMVDEIGIEARSLDLLGREVLRQLVEDRGDHFHVRQLFRADIGQNPDVWMQQDALSVWVVTFISFIDVRLTNFLQERKKLNTLWKKVLSSTF